MSDMHCPEEYWPDVLVALYNHARPAGLGALVHTEDPMTREMAERLLAERKSLGGAKFDYIQGRPIKVRFWDSQVLRIDLYNRDQGGPGTAEKLIREVLDKPENK